MKDNDGDLVFNQSAFWYREFYSSRNLYRIANDVSATLDLKPTDSIIDFGCGCGDVTNELTRYTKNVTGYDVSVEMIKRARENFPDIDFFSNRSDLINKRFDKGVAFFHVSNYIFAQKTIKSFFNDISEIIVHGGKFAFDFWSSDAVRLNGLESREAPFMVKSVQYLRKVVPRFQQPNNVKIEITILAKSTGEIIQKESHNLRIASDDEIKIAADDLGLSIEFCHWPSDDKIALPWSRVALITF